MARHRLREPTWLSRLVVDAIHNDQLREHGGLPGVRDENALESALARPRHLFTYRRSPSLPRLAAALCIGLAKGHPFVDGNKRVALLATYAFLAVNNLVLDADETETAETIEAVAGGGMTETALAAWIASHVHS